MISTGLMIRLGKTYKNLMVDVKASNNKLRKRAIKLVQEITKCSLEECSRALELSHYRVKHAVLRILLRLDYSSANELLLACNGNLEKAISQTL
jgi:N-acetylmuramic acid 6-phosphate etherase